VSGGWDPGGPLLDLHSPHRRPMIPAKRAVERSAKTNVRHPARDMRERDDVNQIVELVFVVFASSTVLETWLSYLL
jgi:hypothetical protein